MNLINTKQLIKAVKKMRKAQKAFFRERTPKNLEEAKQAENDVDGLLKAAEHEIDDIDGKLF